MKIVKLDMPPKAKALTVANEDGSHTIILNARLSVETQATALQHELAHIECDDWHCDMPVGQIERIRHEG